MSTKKEKLKKLIDLKQFPEESILRGFENLETKINETDDLAIEAIRIAQETQKMEGPKGEDGESVKGDKGAKGESIKGDKGDSITGPIGPKGDSIEGRPGKDAKSIDKESVIKHISALIPVPKDGEVGKDGSPDTGEQIVHKINTLEVTLDKQIDATHIKNLSRFINDGVRTLHRGGATIRVDDEGTLLTRKVKQFDFVGSGVTATESGDKVTVTIAGSTDTFATIQEDGVTLNAAAPTLDFDGADFNLSEGPDDDFDITIEDSGINAGAISSGSLTAGGVIFSDGTNLVEDQSQFFWDNTNKFLGIGTDTPLAPVYITSTAATDSAEEFGIFSMLTNGRTTTGSSIGYGGYHLITTSVKSGETNTGSITGTFSSSVRTATADAGILTTQYGHWVKIGTNSSATGSPTTTTSAGLFVDIFAGEGTITNLHGILMSVNETGGTVTNSFGIDMAIPVGGTSTIAIRTNEGDIIFNESGGSYTTRIEASGVSDAFQVNGADGVITLGELTAGFVKSSAGGVLSEQATIDISDDTNLAVTSPIVLTDDTLSLDQSAVDHGSLGGLSDDDHSQYLLLAGRSGGQTAIGGTGAGDDLTLETTSNASKGSYIFSEMTSAGFLKNTTGGVVTGGNSIDISADTNLAVSSPIVLTDDTLSWDFTTNNTWTGNNTFDEEVIHTAHAVVATDGAVVNDSTQKSISAFVDGIQQSLSSVIFIQTASVAVNNTTTETTLIGAGVGTLTLPADFLVAGKTIRVTARGFGNRVSGSLTLKVKFGSTVLTSTGAQTPTMGSDGYEVITDIICRTTGASGTVFAQGYTHVETSTFDMVNTATVTVDTTGTLAVDVTAQWTIASIANIITQSNLIVEVLN